jgi:hypothetical protein
MFSRALLRTATVALKARAPVLQHTVARSYLTRSVPLFKGPNSLVPTKRDDDDLDGLEDELMHRQLPEDTEIIENLLETLQGEIAEDKEDLFEAADTEL